MDVTDFIPIGAGLINLGLMVDAVVKKRVFFFNSRDPDAAIYREFEPGVYWLLIFVNVLISIGLIAGPIFLHVPVAG